MTTTPLPYSYNKGKQQGSVYIFNKDDDSSEDEHFQMKSVRSRNKRGDVKDKEPQDTISHVLIPSDTLASLSLTYSCKVSEIKRINHIWNANELSARDSILIPVVRHSLLLEPPTAKNIDRNDGAEAEPRKVDIRTISIKSHGDSADTEMFLQRMNADIETLLKETREKTKKSSLGEVKNALTVERIFPKQVSTSRTGLSYCTIAAISLGFCFIFVGIPVMLVYWDVFLEGIRENVGNSG